jgi:MFS transporter, DHA2 family, multidrug resistance protein
MDLSRNQKLNEKYGSSYKWIAGFSTVLGLLTTIFSSTMVNVALTDIMETFSITQGSAQWMSTAFLCASSVAMLTTAWFSSKYGVRGAFLIAIGTFLVGSFLGWFSINFPMLVIARILQGAGAGILQPLSMSLIFMLFPADMRGRAMGMFGMGVVIGPALGPVIGGIITDNFDWHTTFSLVIPLAFIAAVLGYIFLPSKEDDVSSGKFNFASLVIVSISVGCLLNGLSSSQFFELTDSRVYPYLLIALTGFTLFIVRELSSATPLVQLRLLKNLNFTSGAIIGTLTSAGMFSSFYLVPLFARTVQSASATDAGMLLLPAGLLLVVVFPIVGRLIDKMPAYRLILFGQVLFIFSTIIISFSNKDTSYFVLASWIIVGRIGLGFVMPSYSTFALSSITPKEVTHASGAMNFIRMMGGSIGVNLTALLITAKTNSYTLKAVQIHGSSDLPPDVMTEVMTHTFSDVFLITIAAFSLSLIPAIYMAISHKKSPA